MSCLLVAASDRTDPQKRQSNNIVEDMTIDLLLADWYTLEYCVRITLGNILI